MKFNIQTASDEQVLLRLANRAERLVRLGDYGAPPDILAEERRLLSEATWEWNRRYPKQEM